MIYFLLLFAVITTSVSGSLTRKRERGNNKLHLIVKMLLANPIAPICWGSFVLLTVVVGLATAQPSAKELRKKKLQLELDVQYEMGQVFAKKMSQIIEKKTKALIIYEVKGNRDREFYQAFLNGFLAGKSEKISQVSEEFIQASKKGGRNEQVHTISLRLPSIEFDNILEKFPDHSVVISLVGLPTNFESSRSWLKASTKEIFLGIATNNPFNLGGMISNQEITACVVPKRKYNDEYGWSENSDISKKFHERYYVIDADNIIQILKKDRRIISLSR